LKLLILCNDFPPLNSIGAQRPYSWYKHLREFGIEPVVITKNWKGHSSTPVDVLRNAGDKNVAVEKTEYGTVVRVPFETTPSERMLLRHGPHTRRYERKGYTLSYRLASFFSARFDAHRHILNEADKYLSENHVDGIITTGEPFILFRYCYLLHNKHRLPWIADYRDGWKLNYVRRRLRDPLNLFQTWYEFQFEKRYVRTAACITTIDPILAASLADLHRKPVEVVYNGFDGFYDGPRESPSPGVPLVINHTGTLTPGQRVETLLQAVKELLAEHKIQSREISLRFIGLDYFPDQCERVKRFDPTVATCIETTPRIPRADVLRMNCGADYQVTFTEETFKMINAKTYDYLAVRRPVLIVPGDGSILTKLIDDLQAGESLNTVAEVKSFIHQAVERKRKGLVIAPYPLREEAALFYTRRQQAKRLADVVRKYFAVP